MTSASPLSEAGDLAAAGPGADHWTIETVERVKVTHSQTGRSAEAPTRAEAFGALVAELVTAGEISINAGRNALGVATPDLGRA